jgi:KDO2-lipid IV(A) lauroyltransferase
LWALSVHTNLSAKNKNGLKSFRNKLGLGKRVKNPKMRRIFGNFLAVINLIPLRARAWFFRIVGDFAYFLDERHRRIALRNLTLAFPERGEQARRKIARASFRHVATVLAEFSFIPKLNRQKIENYIWIEGLDHFRKAKEKNGASLTAHFETGNGWRFHRC